MSIASSILSAFGFTLPMYPSGMVVEPLVEPLPPLNLRIRYSQDCMDGPKNTMVTIKDGNRIYFGIARCNAKAKDHFNRKQGRGLATTRCIQALMSDPKLKHPFEDELEALSFVDGKFLSGVVVDSGLHTLLSYFEFVDYWALDVLTRHP